METKEIHFRVSKHLYEKFHRLFPGRGEKTIFFRRIMEVASETLKDRDAFVKGILEEAEENYGSD